MVLIRASIRWSHIFILSTCNQAFVKLLAQLRAHFLDYLIKILFFYNTSEITPHVFH